MKLFLKIVFGTLFVVVALALLVWMRPSLVINNGNLKYAQAYLKKQGMILTWGAADVQAISHSFFRKELRLGFQDVCFEMPADSVRACFRRFLGDVSANFARLKPELEFIQVTTAEGDVKISDIEALVQLSAETEAVEAPAPNNWKARARVEATLKKYGIFNADVSLRPKDHRYFLAGTLDYADGPRTANLKFAGDTGEGEHHVKWDAKSRRIISAIPSLECRQCRLALKETPGKKQDIDLTCPLNVVLALPNAADFPVTSLMDEVDLSLDAKLSRNLAKDDMPVAGKVTLAAETLFKKIKEGKATLTLDVNGRVEDPLDRWNYTLDSDFSIERFQKIVVYLRETSWAVPAPFNVLDGKIETKIQGTGSVASGYGDFPIKLSTDLASKTQRLKLSSDNRLHFSEKENGLDLKIELQDVRLVMPTLDLRKPPRVLPDSRIHRTEASRQLAEKAAKDPAEKFRLSLDVKSLKPVRIASNLTKGDVPINVNIQMPDEKNLSGVLQANGFKVELFRRLAEVDFIRVALAPDSGKNEIQGKILVSYTDYDITIELMGLLEAPTIEIYSDPPLPEKQALAVLLFGRTLDELDSDSADSVGNARAAMADGAIGLASLYALASTPVESIGYDSRTQTFTAKVRLADGTSLNVGSDLKAVNQIGIRKRLSSRWSLNTYLENPFLSAKRALTSALEWSIRY